MSSIGHGGAYHEGCPDHVTCPTMPTFMQNRELAATEAAGGDRELTFKKKFLKKKFLKKNKKGKVRL